MASIISFSCTSSNIPNPFCGVTCEVGYEDVLEKVSRYVLVPAERYGDLASPP